MKDLITLPSFNGVAAGSTATLTLPKKGTYHGLSLTYTESGSAAISEANVEGGIDEIRLKINGTVQRTFSPGQLFDINRYLGQAFANSTLPIFFAEPWARTSQGEDAKAWGMDDVDTFQIEVDVASAATTPGLTAKALWSNDKRPLGAIEKWKRFTFSPAAAGSANLSTLPKTDAYSAVHLFHSYVTSAKATVDSTERWADLTIAEATAWAAQWGRAAQSGMYTIDFGVSNRVSDILPVIDPATKQQIADLRFDITVSQADNITVLTRTVGLRD